MAIQEDMAGIEHLLGDIDQIPRIAFTKYRAYPADILLEHDPRAVAACIYAHMVAEADRRWLERRGITMRDINGLKVWLVEDKAVLRWKRMDIEGRSRNYQTPQAKDYDLGKPLPGLPEPAVRLTAGYLADATNTQYLRTQVARPRGKRVEWCAALVPASAPGDRAKWEDATRQASF